MKAGGKTSNPEIIRNIMKSSMENKKILLGLTTTPNSDWREKIREIDRFGIKEVALFITFLKDKKDREELYRLLEKTGLETIPHVHLRSPNMKSDEIDYLIKRYKTKFFNVHPLASYPNNPDYLNYKNLIYVENTDFVPTEKEVEKFAGICLDFSHKENYILENDSAYTGALNNLIDKYKIGCGHASAVKKEPRKDLEEFDSMPYCAHFMKDISEFEYLKKYINLIPEFLSIELENSFKEQLKVKEYLGKMIN
jgi:hypothetical protein